MTRKSAGVLAAGMVALGILVANAGTLVARDATVPQTDMAAVMAEHMGGSDLGSMMQMMGMMSGGAPGASAMPMRPDQHDLHHPSASSEVRR